ncbi:MAG TPA: VOC family protein [Myxococcota bacterium]|nr:VOC family protein [Myxococcota bacterium]HND32387.1 VOC family protein [Myxococcota bacterium]HNH49604.1 VOC family protein [Myxococcota bacterium]
MNPTPPGWPRLSPALIYQDPASAIDFLERAFGFSTRIRVDTTDGGVAHSELCYGDALVMASGERLADNLRSPRSLGGAMTAGIFLYVDDVDAHCARAKAAGAEIIQELTDTDYGEGYWKDRGYGCLDPEGHRWWFAQRL